MKDVPDISDSKFKVMEVLWEESPLTARQIIERLQKDNNWSENTIKTFINM